MVRSSICIELRYVFTSNEIVSYGINATEMHLVGLGWESDVSQASCQRCEGSSIDQAPYVSKYHLAKCGSINMFNFGTKTCEVYSFSNMCGLSHTQEIS